MGFTQYNKIRKGMYFFTVLLFVLMIVPFEIVAGILNSEAGRLQLPYGTRFKMHVNGNTAYIGAYTTGELCVVDVFNKSTPYLLSKTFVAGQSIHDIWFSNNRVYFTHRFGGVTKIDVSNSSAPVAYPFCMMTTYTHNGIKTSINPTLQTEVLYVADHQATVPFRIFNPVNNQQIGSFPNVTDGREIEVTSDGNYLFQATWGSSPSINIYDVRNPSSILMINKIDIYANEMVISPDNKYLYLTYDSPADNKTEGVMIINILNPASAYIERMIPLPGARELTVDYSGKRIFVRTRSDMASSPVPTGIYAFDINTLGSEWQIDFLPTTADREDFDIWYDNEYLYYTDNTNTGSQFVILHIGVANHNQPPIVNNVNVTINEDSYTNINFNASDPELAPLTYNISQNPQFGHVLGTFPNVYYYPNSNFNGTDQFKCTVSDGEMSKEATATIIVIPVNDPPIISAIPDKIIAEGSPLEFNVYAMDLENDPITLTASALPSGSTFMNGVFRWTPNLQQASVYYAQFIASDSKLPNSLTVKITVTNTNQAPVANAQNVNTSEDYGKSIYLSGSDPDGQSINYLIDTQPVNGTLSGTPPSLLYKPNANYNGVDVFTFKVSDGSLNSPEATVSITVNAVNDLPVFTSPITWQVDENVPLTFVATGSDADGDAVTFSAENLPSGATFINNTFSWTPNFNQAGDHYFSILISDGKVTLRYNEKMTVNNVNRAPVANAQSIITDEDNTKSIVLSCSDPDGGAVTYTVITQPANGTLSGNAPDLTFTPNANFNGSDAFAYRISDGVLSAEATISITVNSVNDAPVLNSILPQTVNENALLTFATTGSDIDGDALSFSATNLPSGATLNTNGTFSWTPTYEQSGNYTVTISVSDGNSSVSQNVTIIVNNVNRKPVANARSITTNEDNAVALILTGSDPDGEALTYTVIAGPSKGTFSGTAPNLSYTPNANYNGSDVITFSVSDGDLSDQATIAITVNAVNDAPVLNAIAAQSVEENSSLTFTAIGSDIDQDALTFTATNLPSGASFNNRTFTWNPTFEQAGTYTITVSVNDGNETVSQEVVITVTNLNRGPSADVQSVTTSEDKSITITLSGSDPDGEELTYTVVSGPSNGTLTGTAPNLTYVPNANFNGSDAITFSVSDGSLSAEATVEIAVNAVNDAPVLNAIAAQSVEENSSLTFTAIGSDIDQDALTFTATNLPSGASFNNRTFTWNPTFEQAGTYTITVSVNDGNETVSQDVVVTVSNLNRGPSADAQNVITSEDKSIVITLSGSDPDGEELAYTVVSGPSNGTLTGTAPNLTYVPNANFNGRDAITFSVSDGSLSAEATVEIAVNAVNDAPVLNAIAAQSVEENSSLTFTAIGSDIDQDALTFTATNLPSGASFNNRTFTWNPTFEQSGTYTITVSVNDGNETVSQDVVVTVSNLNRGPSADAQSVITSEDKSIAITLSGSDPDGEELTYTVVSGPSNGTVSGTAPNLTYVPNANFNGSDAITFSVSDGSLIASATITVSVSAVNDAPVINAIPAQSIDENAVLTFTAVGSDIDGDGLTLRASNLPTGATFRNGTFSWLPTFEQAGLYMITVSITDGKLTASRNVSITVVNKPVKSKIYMYDEAMSNPAGSNPRLYIVNTSNEIIHGCRIEYYFKADNGRIPQLDLYYNANVKVTLASRGNGDYTIVYDLSGVNIAPGAIFPNTGGMVVGISYKDWSTVDKTNDYSNNQARAYVENNRICVYDNSNWLLGGIKPTNTTILPFAVAGNDIWSTNPKVILNASKSYDLLGAITSYEWIVNGNVVSTEVSPYLTFNYGVTTVTLKVTNNSGVLSTDEVKVNIIRDTEVLFAASSEPISQNAPFIVEYYVPTKMAGCAINLMASNAWGGSNIVTVSGTAGYHSENIYAWTKSALGGSGPWSVKCKVNGIVTQTLSIKFNY